MVDIKIWSGVSDDGSKTVGYSWSVSACGISHSGWCLSREAAVERASAMAARFERAIIGANWLARNGGKQS